MKFQINNIRAIWNRECNILDGDIVEVDSFDAYEGKYYIGVDVKGTMIWFDSSDIEDGFVEEY